MSPVEHSDRHRLLECQRCELQVWDPADAGNAQWYESSEHYATTPFIDWLGWHHRHALDTLPGEGRTLLDIGCADGRFVYAAAARGIDAVGIDHSATLVGVGNDRYGGSRLSRTSIEEFRAAGRTFDVVTLFDVIEHVPDPLALLALARNVTRPGGTLIVSTPSRLGYPWGRHPMDRPPHHLTRWTPTALRWALDATGLGLSRLAFSPGEVGLRAFLLDHLRFGIVKRLLRRRRGTVRAGTVSAPDIRGLVVAKDRVVRAMARAFSPVAGRRFAGGTMIATATRPTP